MEEIVKPVAQKDHSSGSPKGPKTHLSKKSKKSKKKNLEKLRKKRAMVKIDRLLNHFADEKWKKKFIPGDYVGNLCEFSVAMIRKETYLERRFQYLVAKQFQIMDIFLKNLAPVNLVEAYAILWAEAENEKNQLYEDIVKMKSADKAKMIVSRLIEKFSLY